MEQTQWVYDFAEGSRDMRDLLGGKGANVAEMTRVLGAGARAGRVHDHHRGLRRLHAGRQERARRASPSRSPRRSRGSRSAPASGSATPTTRCSSRSARGARESMPGMLDTVLNLGLNDESVEGLAERDRQRALRLGLLPALRADVRQRRAAAFPASASRTRSSERQGRARGQARHRARRRGAARADRRASRSALRVPAGPAGAAAPGDPRRLRLLDGRPRRRLPAHQPHPRRLGHGGQRPADGLRQQGRHVAARASPSAATRSPARPSPRGDFLVNAQGEDVVSGVRNTRDIAELADVMPEAHEQLMEILRTLERHYGDMQDTEFTVEEGRLYMLQTRNAKRPGAGGGALRRRRGRRGPARRRSEALTTIDAERARRAAAPDLRPRRPSSRCSRSGVAASPGAAKGEIVFTAAEAVAAAAAGPRRDPRAPVHRGRRRRRLPRRQGDPHLRGRQGLARGARRARHGRARAWSAPPRWRSTSRRKARPRRRHGARTRATSSRSTARAAASRSTTCRCVEPEVNDELRARARVGRRAAPRSASAPTPTRPEDAQQGARVRRRGHRPLPHRAHVHGRGPPAEDAGDDHGRRHRGRAATALAELLPLQQDDFEGIFEAMGGLPVTIRLLDPPLHEFLPHLPRARARGRARADRAAPTTSHELERTARARPTRCTRQPDARHPRRPARDPATRDLRDAGRGDHARPPSAVDRGAARRRS